MCVYICILVHAKSLYVCVHAHMYIYVYIYICILVHAKSLYVCVHAHMYIYVHIYVYTCAC